MLYAVSARLIPDRAGEFFTRLTDGSIAAQRPDGQEIVAAMGRACIGSDGTVRWTETCFCPTPLKHERETVLDRYFTDIETDLHRCAGRGPRRAADGSTPSRGPDTTLEPTRFRTPGHKKRAKRWKPSLDCDGYARRD